MGSPARVLFILPWADALGGGETQFRTALRHLDRTAVEPAVVFLDEGPFEREVAAQGIRTFALPTPRLRRGGRIGRTTARLAALLRAERPDLVFSWGIKGHFYAAPAAAAAGMTGRLVWWQLGIPRGQPVHRLVTLLPARAVFCATDVIVEAQRALWPHRRTIKIEPGVDAPRRPADGEVEALRADLGIPPGRPVAGVLGRLEPGKRQEVLIDAVALLRDRGRDAHALIVGGDAFGLNPGYAASLRRRVAERGVEDRCTFTGQVADPGPYYALMDVFACTSEEEPFGLVIPEALAAGVPVVAVGRGGPADMLADGRSGVLVDAPSADLFAGAIGALLDDDERRRTLVAGGLERFRTAYSGERMTRELERALAGLAAEVTRAGAPPRASSPRPG